MWIVCRDWFYDWWDSFSCLFIVFVLRVFLFGECGDWLSWLFSRLIEMIVVFGSAWLNDCLLLFYFLTHFVINRYDCILRLIVCRVCFERVFDWMIVWIVCRDCLSWLFYVILFWFFVERLCFCEKEEKLWSDGALQRCCCQALRQNECGLIHAVDLLIWVCIVCCENDFVFWTSLCERWMLNRLTNSGGNFSCVEGNAAICLVLFL